jgi:hypothetical protein
MDLIYHADVWPHQDASSSVYPSYLSSVSQNSNSYLQRSHATELLNDLHRLLERFLSRDAMSAIRNKINLGSPSVHPLQCIQRSSSSLQPSSTYIYEPLVTSRVRCARDLWLGDLGEGDGRRLSVWNEQPETRHFVVVIHVRCSLFMLLVPRINLPF